MSQQPKQQLQLNPIQMLQITDMVLQQLREWVEKKAPEEVSHPEKDRTAIASLHHARLLANLRCREIIVEVQKRQEAERRAVTSRLPPQSQLNLAAAQVLGQNTAAKTLDELWREAGLSQYLEIGAPRS